MSIEAVGPDRHRALQEVLVGAQAELEHPLRLVLERADLLDRVVRQATLGLGQVDDLVLEVELRAVVIDLLALSKGHRVSGPRLRAVALSNSDFHYRD